MSAIAGIVSLHLQYSLEKLRSMLHWGKAHTLSEDIHQISTSQTESVFLGMAGTDCIFDDIDKQITVALLGTVLDKNKLLTTLSLPEDCPSGYAIAAGYALLGEQVFDVIDGDYIICIIDKKKKELLIARDRFGSRDLFWHLDSRALIFSDSLKALLSTGIIAAAPDLYALSSYLFLGYISQDKTPIQKINRLLPGYFLKISFEGKMSIKPFWSLSSYFTHAKKREFDNSEELYQTIEKSIHSSINKRLDVDPSCQTVMGGTRGSQLITNYLSGTSTPTPTLEAYFTDHMNSSEKKGHILQIDEKMFFSELPQAVFTTEMPVANFDHIRYYHAAKWCARHNLTPFFDTGFDELFLDYASTHAFTLSSPKDVRPRAATLLQKTALRFARLFCRILPSTYLRLLRDSERDDPRIRFIKSRGQLFSKELSKLSPTIGGFFQPDLFLHQFYHINRIESGPASLFYLLMKTEVIDKMHTPRSRLAQAQGLTPQAPFIDKTLIELFAELGDSLWASPDILSSFPEYALKGPYKEKGTQIPDGWLENKMINCYFLSLEKGLLVDGGFITAKFIRDRACHKDIASFKILYALLILEVWMHLFIDMPLKPDSGKVSIEELLL